MYDHRVDTPERGGQLGQRQRIDDRAAALPATDDLDGQHPAGDAGAELADRDVVLGVARKAGIQDTQHAVLTLEPGRQCRGGPGVAIDPHGERQDPAQDEEGIERTDGGPRIDLDLLDLPDEVGSAGDDPSDDVAVPRQELRRGLDDEIRPELERPADVWRGEGVVDDVRRPVLVGEAGDRRVVGHHGRRVGDGLRVDDAGRCRGRSPRPRPRCRSGPRNRR